MELPFQEENISQFKFKTINLENNNKKNAKGFSGFLYNGLNLSILPFLITEAGKKIIKGTLHSFKKKKKKKRILSLIHKLLSVLIAAMQSVSICTRLKLSPVVKRVEYPLFMLNANLLPTTN